jgi:hypothetical protein
MADSLSPGTGHSVRRVHHGHYFSSSNLSGNGRQGVARAIVPRDVEHPASVPLPPMARWAAAVPGFEYPNVIRPLIVTSFTH